MLNQLTASKKKFLIIALCISLIFIIAACNRLNQQNKQNSNQSQTKAGIEKTQVHSNIIEINANLIDIMSQVDLIPYYEEQIKEKKKEENEKEKKQQKSASQGQGEQGQQESPSNGGSSSNGSSGGGKEEFKPKPVTINDILLSKVLEQEKTYQTEQTKERKIPDDIVCIWHEINNQVNKLHQKWDDLKPKLTKLKIPQDKTTDFEDRLNDLTIASTNKKYMETLEQTNKSSSIIPDFIEKSKDKTLASMYRIKYYVRKILLDAANNKTDIEDKIKKIKEAEKQVSKRLEENDEKELSQKIASSIDNLKKAAKTNDINVLKIKGSIVVKNIAAAREKLSVK